MTLPVLSARHIAALAAALASRTTFNRAAVPSASVHTSAPKRGEEDREGRGRSAVAAAAHTAFPKSGASGARTGRHTLSRFCTYPLRPPAPDGSSSKGSAVTDGVNFSTTRPVQAVPAVLEKRLRHRQLSPRPTFRR